jgi:methylated-DNA-protein-cysteine methyltransferase-like protein
VTASSDGRSRRGAGPGAARTPGTAGTADGAGTFTEAVAAVIGATAPGEVVTYGEVAAEAGFPGAARAVGAFLARSPGGLPWWRVVTASGRLVPGHEREHARLLRAEGIVVRDGRVRVPRDPGRRSSRPVRRGRRAG